MNTKRVSLGKSVSVKAALDVSNNARKPAASVKIAEDITGVGIRMPRSMHESLRTISFKRRVSLNQLLVEGVRGVIAADKAGTLKIAGE